MIYVIAAAYTTSGVTSEQLIANKKLLSSYTYSFSIKIGYTTDFTKRRSQYSTDTPEFFVLFTYEGGTEEDEKRLHLYFSKFSDDRLNGREWFKWDEEIIEFFESHSTIESIRGAIPLLKKDEKEAYFRFEVLANPILYKLIKDEGEENNYERLLYLHNEILDIRKEVKTVSELFSVLKTIYDPAKIDEISSWYSSQSSLIADIETNVQHLSTISNFTDKMRFVCGLVPTLDQAYSKIFLDSIPMVFKKYYVALGPGGCGSCKYQQPSLEREYQRRINNQSIEPSDIRAAALKFFQIGEKRTKSAFKEKVAEFYKSIGLIKNAKASDLKEWFDTKPCLIQNKETKKRDNGFEIVGIKY